MANDDVRVTLGEAIGFVRGREYTKSVLGQTLGDFISQRIDDIEIDTPDSESDLTRIKRIRQQIDDIVSNLEKQNA